MQHEDFVWFVDNHKTLFETYGEAYLAIYNKSIIGAFDNPREAINAATKVAPIGSFIIQYNNGDESGYTNYISSMNFM